MTTDSKANYTPKNVAPLIESFAGMLGKSRTALKFHYVDDKGNVTEVQHPNDKSYLDDYRAAHSTKSAALIQYEQAAARSSRLAAYEAASPAKIKYFQT